MVAGAGRARRPPHAGDEARPTTTRRSWPSRWPATTSSTTARAAGTASRSPSARARRRRRRHELRRRAGPRQRPRRGDRAERGGLQPVRRGADGRAPSMRRRPASSSASTPRTAGSSARPFYDGKLRWFERLRALAATRRSDPTTPLVLGGDLNVAPTDDDVWDAAAVHGGTHVSEPERERVPARSSTGGSSTPTAQRHAEPGRFTWWDYRAGNFHKNVGMRIDHLLVTAPVADRVVVGRDRPRGPQGHADPVRPRAARPRPRRARHAVRRRLDRRRCRGSPPARDRRADDRRRRVRAPPDGLGCA